MMAGSQFTRCVAFLLPAGESEHLLQSNIYEFRKRSKWTLRHLSQLSGIPVNTVWRMERGYGVTLRNAFRIAGAFGVTVYDLWNFTLGGSAAARRSKDFVSVRQLRLEHQWRLSDLAKIAGVSKATLFGVETGHTPTLENAFRIAAALGVSVYEIWNPSSVASGPTTAR
jgi:transcriptional regulator with XRE-family HTH domain